MKLSLIGQLKSAVFTVQLAARSLGNLATVTRAPEVKNVSVQFVAAFNSTIDFVQTVTSMQGDKLTSQNADALFKDMRHIWSADATTIETLRQYGLTQGLNGKLTLDAIRFDAEQKSAPQAVEGALAQIGQSVDESAAQELFASGRIEAFQTLLKQRTALLQNQQKMLASNG